MARCPICGNTTPEGRFCEHCGAQLVSPVPVDPSAYGRNHSPDQPANPPFAGFWIRFFAWILDSVIIGIVLLIVIIGILYEGNISTSTVHGQYSDAMNTAMWTAFVVTSIISWLYSALLESSPTQATLGKQAMGLIVTDYQGKRITFGPATLRWVGKSIAAFAFCIGYLIIGFTEKKQGLHDFIASTYVVHKNRRE